GGGGGQAAGAGGGRPARGGPAGGGAQVPDVGRPRRPAGPHPRAIACVPLICCHAPRIKPPRRFRPGQSPTRGRAALPAPAHLGRTLMPWLTRASKSATRSHGRACRPRLEALEGRLAPATFTVTNTNDTGPGSLRQAILSADATVAADAIAFAIPGAGVHAIVPVTPLPAVTRPLAVRGATQPGYSGSPL